MPVSPNPVASFRLPHAPSQAEAIFPAPDGSLWFSAANGVPGEARRYVLAVERVMPSGEISTIADRLGAEGFAKTADGSVWFTGFRSIGRFEPSGALTKFPLPEAETVTTIDQGPIVTGADGNVWFYATRWSRPPSGEGEETSVPLIDRLTPSGEFTEFELPDQGHIVPHLASGPDGRIWFAESGPDKIGRLGADGHIDEFQLPRYADPLRLAAGPDGNMWFTETLEGSAAIGRITPAGEITHFALPTDEQAYAVEIAAGPDGRLWFSYGAGAIGRIDTDGRISRVRLPDATFVTSIATGAEGNVWYTATGEGACPEGDAACREAPPTEAAIVGRIEPAALGAAIEAIRSVAGGRGAKVRIACVGGLPSQVCRGRLTLRLRDEVVARRRFALTTDSSRELRLSLSPATRTMLLERGGLRIACSATVAGGRSQLRKLRLERWNAAVGPGEALDTGRHR